MTSLGPKRIIEEVTLHLQWGVETPNAFSHYKQQQTTSSKMMMHLSQNNPFHTLFLILKKTYRTG